MQTTNVARARALQSYTEFVVGILIRSTTCDIRKRMPDMSLQQHGMAAGRERGATECFATVSGTRARAYTKHSAAQCARIIQTSSASRCAASSVMLSAATAVTATAAASAATAATVTLNCHALVSVFSGLKMITHPE